MCSKSPRPRQFSTSVTMESTVSADSGRSTNGTIEIQTGSGTYHLSTGSKAAIAVSTTSFFLVLFMVAATIWRHRRRDKKGKTSTAAGAEKQQETDLLSPTAGSQTVVGTEAGGEGSPAGGGPSETLLTGRSEDRNVIGAVSSKAELGEQGEVGSPWVILYPGLQCSGDEGVMCLDKVDGCRIECLLKL